MQGDATDVSAAGSPPVSSSSLDSDSGAAPLDDGGDSESQDFAVAMAVIANETRGSDISVLHVAPLIYWTRFMVRQLTRLPVGFAYKDRVCTQTILSL